MIITRLRGGLGNQLFQYAAGLNLSLHYGVQLRIDVAYYKKQKVDMLELIQDVAVAGDGDIEQAIGYRRDRFSLKMLIRRIMPRVAHVRAVEPGYSGDLAKLGENAYLDGYWQSYRYVEPILERLREGIAAHRQIPIRKNAICVHIRRGDYMSPKLRIQYGCLSVEYFSRLVRQVRAEHPGCRVILFTNAGPESEFDEIGEHERVRGGSVVEDFLQMMSCSVHIISNSTFSWWAAALATADAVYAPQPLARSLALCTRDLMPPEWRLQAANYE